MRFDHILHSSLFEDLRKVTIRAERYGIARTQHTICWNRPCFVTVGFGFRYPTTRAHLSKGYQVHELERPERTQISLEPTRISQYLCKQHPLSALPCGTHILPIATDTTYKKRRGERTLWRFRDIWHRCLQFYSAESSRATTSTRNAASTTMIFSKGVELRVKACHPISHLGNSLSARIFAEVCTCSLQPFCVLECVHGLNVAIRRWTHGGQHGGMRPT